MDRTLTRTRGTAGRFGYPFLDIALVLLLTSLFVSLFATETEKHCMRVLMDEKLQCYSLGK